MVSDHLVEALDACDEPQLLHRDSLIKSKANSVRFPLACLAHNLLLHVAMRTADSLKPTKLIRSHKTVNFAIATGDVFHGHREFGTEAD